jgi:lysophospholipase L1-like esterase
MGLVRPGFLRAGFLQAGFLRGRLGGKIEEVAIVGDSISTYGGNPGFFDPGYVTYGRIRSGSRYNYITNPDLANAPYFAVGGSRLYYVANVRIPGLVDDAIASGTNLIFMHAGTNDVQAGGCSEANIDDFSAAYEAEVLKCRAAGVKFVGSTLVGPSESADNPDLKADYARANDAIRALAASLNFPLADFAAVTSSGTPGETLDEYIAPAFGGDNLHPNPAGAHVMGAEQARALDPLLGDAVIDSFWEDVADGTYGLELTGGYLFPAFTSNIPNGGYDFTLATGATSSTLGSESATDGNWWTFDLVDTVKTAVHTFTGFSIPGIGHKGTAQGGGASTITLASGASETNNGYQASTRNNWIWITGGTGAGQVRRITGYVGATKVATVDVAWVTVPDSTSTYEVGTRTGERFMGACEVDLDSDFELRGAGLLIRAQQTPQNIGDGISGGSSISVLPIDMPPTTRPLVYRTPITAVTTTSDRFRPRFLLVGNGSGKIRKFCMFAVDRTEGQLTFTP